MSSALVTFLQAVIEANNRRLSFIETNCAVPESDVPNEVTGFEGLSCSSSYDLYSSSDGSWQSRKRFCSSAFSAIARNGRSKHRSKCARSGPRWSMRKRWICEE